MFVNVIIYNTYYKMFVKCKCFRPESFKQLVYIMMEICICQHIVF